MIYLTSYNNQLVKRDPYQVVAKRDRAPAIFQEHARALRTRGLIRAGIYDRSITVGRAGRCKVCKLGTREPPLSKAPVHLQTEADSSLHRRTNIDHHFIIMGAWQLLTQCYTCVRLIDAMVSFRPGLPLSAYQALDYFFSVTQPEKTKKKPVGGGGGGG